MQFHSSRLPQTVSQVPVTGVDLSMNVANLQARVNLEEFREMQREHELRVMMRRLQIDLAPSSVNESREQHESIDSDLNGETQTNLNIDGQPN